MAERSEVWSDRGEKMGKVRDRGRIFGKTLDLTRIQPRFMLFSSPQSLSYSELQQAFLMSLPPSIRRISDSIPIIIRIRLISIRGAV